MKTKAKKMSISYERLMSDTLDVKNNENRRKICRKFKCSLKSKI